MEERLVAFLERLLGEPIKPGAAVAVSSTQRAQIVAWLNAQGIPADFKRFNANLMSVSDMLAGGADQPGAAPAPAKPSIPPLRPVRQLASSAVPLGLGVDLQSRGAMPAASDYRSDRFYSVNFSDRELSHCIEQGDPLESFTGLWAAKEAIIKAGAASPAKPGMLGDIEITHDAQGAPSFPGCLISISHEGGMVVAVCIRLG